MSKTIRKVSQKKGYAVCIRRPRHKWKILAGESKKQIVTDWDDKIVSAVKEMGVFKRKMPGSIKASRHR